MPPIPAYVSLYGPVVLALAASLTVAAVGRRHPGGHHGWMRPGLAFVCVLGWAALEPGARWRAAAVGPAMLIVAGAGVLLVELVRRWRAGRNDRLLSVVAAGWVGWWLARVAAAPGEFWRVGIVTAGVAGLIAWLVGRQPGRSLALALALCGGLAVSGFPAAWIVAGAVMAVACAGPLALRVPAVMPSAIMAALLAGADLARGRLARGHLNGADAACLFALAAPVLVGSLEARCGTRWRRPGRGRASLRRRA